MNNIDMLSPEAEHMPPAKRARRRSFTEKLGQVAFEEALAQSTADELVSEAAYAIPTSDVGTRTLQIMGETSSPPEQYQETLINLDPEAGSNSEFDVASEPETDIAVETESAAEVEMSAAPDITESDVETEPVGDTESAAETEVVAEMEATAETEIIRETEAVAETEGTAETETIRETEAVAETEGTAVGTDADVDMDVEPVEAVTDPEITSMSGATVEDDVTTTSPRAMPIAATTFVDTWGRQAFSRSTQLHKDSLNIPAEVEIDELAQQIAKTRGTMVAGRARVVIGEGSDRLALTVLVQNGTVNIDARSVDAELASSLEQGRSELADALSRHGLDLGTMDTSSEQKSPAQESESEAWEDVDDLNDEPIQELQRRHRGVRVVA